ncbi:Ctr9p NDAI_0G03710 [Naumovozyma dairenensis CBS 421]|uniref:Uncharacterized protein n=1 Tax=Naumovozyma dairenensis (strain ATCC 10597 / BCRC 20456 / CBS 421 / NBRC 0211 / NRRL Y-12639) TaxID=1071378 RepID=G0WED7_NAUDC|nr:hypothetical protein NDAI_0G03710 [Naumovozyma dairenensis CBS 421]CCD26148.2 hypothetical protein NDAI_0G03710 [Naumovozyma dairenensis CBS 421]
MSVTPASTPAPTMAAVAAYPSMEWATTLDIPLKASEELVSIDLLTDLPDDPSDLRTLLVEESASREHWLTIACSYVNQGRIDAGIELIKMALQVDHFVDSKIDMGHFYTFLTWCHLKKCKLVSRTIEEKFKYLNEAENCLKEAIGINPTWVCNMLATVDLYYQRGHYDKALETCDLFVKGLQQDVTNLATTNASPNCMFLLLRAKLLFRKKNFMASLKLFQELLVNNPVLKPDPRIGIGACFWQLKDYKMAINAWERSLELDPTNKNSKVLCLLGKFHKTLIDSGNDDEFKDNFKDAMIDLSNIYQTENGKENPVLLTLLQSYYYYKGDYKKILNIYEERIKPISSIVTDTILSESTLWCGRAYYALNDYRQAFAMFQESLKKNEDNLLSKLGLGQTQIKTNLLEESVLTFENIYKTNENIQELNYILGLLYAGKCLDKKDSRNNQKNDTEKKNASNKELSIMNSKAIKYLEKYIKSTNSKRNQLVIPRAYFVISQLYESTNQYKQSLEYLIKALEEVKFVKNGRIDDVPIELLNNLGSFYYMNGDMIKTKEYFQLAKEKLTSGSSLSSSTENESTLITVNYNIARSLESEPENITKAQELYEDILSKHPNYISAKIRNLFYKYLNHVEDPKMIENEMESLNDNNESNLEIRSFYSWFLKKNTTTQKREEKQTSYNKDTLVKYDSHDLYALISLGNLYCIIGRECRKNVKEQEKSKHSYLKSIQLFQKVLQIDPMNVFAAQGIAIIFAESKRLGPALEILRKVRDSIDNEDVHINLANCLLEMREFNKAIENYDLILKKFPKISNKSHILNLLAKTWYSRGLKEKKIEFFFKALVNTEDAIKFENVKETKNERFLSILKFNVALLNFQIAETLRRSNVKERRIKDLQKSVKGLDDAINILKELNVSKDFNIIPKEELEQRIQLGETTMKNVLERCLMEQEQYERDQKNKLLEARKLLEEQELKVKEQLSKEEEEKRLKLEKQTEEYKRLQDEAQKLIQERESLLVEEDNVSDKAFSGDEDEASNKKPKRKRKRAATATTNGESGKKPKQKRQKKSRGVISDDESEEEEEAKLTADEDEDDAIVSRRGKKSTLSNEMVDESDEESDIEDDEEDKDDGNDGLF